jgi:hypothetical protein
MASTLTALSRPERSTPRSFASGANAAKSICDAAFGRRRSAASARARAAGSGRPGHARRGRRTGFQEASRSDCSCCSFRSFGVTTDAFSRRPLQSASPASSCRAASAQPLMSSLPAQPLLAAHAAVPDGAARRRGTRGVASLGSVAGCLRRVRGRWHCLYTSVAGRGSVVVLTGPFSSRSLTRRAGRGKALNAHRHVPFF